MSFYSSLTNVHEDPNKNSKMNMILMNIAHFLDMYLFCFMVESNIMIVPISNAIVIVMIEDVV